MRDADDDDFQKPLPDFDLLQAIEAGLEALKKDQVHSFYDKVAGTWTYDQLIAVLRRCRALAAEAKERARAEEFGSE